MLIENHEEEKEELNSSLIKEKYLKTQKDGVKYKLKEKIKDKEVEKEFQSSGYLKMYRETKLKQTVRVIDSKNRSRQTSGLKQLSIVEEPICVLQIDIIGKTP